MNRRKRIQSQRMEKHTAYDALKRLAELNPEYESALTDLKENYVPMEDVPSYPGHYLVPKERMDEARKAFYSLYGELRNVNLSLSLHLEQYSMPLQDFFLRKWKVFTSNGKAEIESTTLEDITGGQS